MMMPTTASREPRTERQAAVTLLAQTAHAQHDASFDPSVLHRQLMPPGSPSRTPQHPYLRRVRAGAPSPIAYPLAHGLRHPSVHESGEPVTPSEIHDALDDDDSAAARARAAAERARAAGMREGQRLARAAVPARVWRDGFIFGLLVAWALQLVVQMLISRYPDMLP